MDVQYQLLKALIMNAQEPSHNGKTGTPIVGYVLKDLITGEIKPLAKTAAWVEVLEFGCINAEAKTREFEGKVVRYLKPTNGKKINEYMVHLGDEID